MISGLTKNYYITSGMQKISPIHRFTLKDKADFRVPGPKQSQPYLTMCIPKVIFSFPDTMYEYAKKSAQFIHLFLRDRKTLYTSYTFHFFLRWHIPLPPR